MPGGLLNIVSYGAANIILNGNCTIKVGKGGLGGTGGTNVGNNPGYKGKYSEIKGDNISYKAIGGGGGASGYSLDIEPVPAGGGSSGGLGSGDLIRNSDNIHTP